MQKLLDNLDRGFHHLVATQRKTDDGLPGYAVLSKEAERAGYAPSDAEAAAREKRFLRRFRADRETYAGAKVAAFARDTWALDAALAHLGIQTHGPDAHRTDKFFSTSSSTVLFPTFVETQAVAGMLLVSLVPDMVAQEVAVNSHICEHLTMAESAAQRTSTKSGEGARVHELTLKTTAQSIKLEKYACGLSATYESLRLQRLNVVALFLQRVGQQLGIDETDDAIQVAIAGDGNSGSAVTDTDAEVSGTLDYDELIRLSLAFTVGYEMRLCILNDTRIRTLLNMSQFQDADLGDNAFTRFNVIPGPLSAMWKRWTSTGSAAFSTDRILALDNRAALVQYTEAGLLTEADRLIDRQFELSTVSKWTGFGKWDYAATQCLDIDT